MEWFFTMSVYTQLQRDEILLLLENYHLGHLEAFEGVNDGVTNTIYHLTTTQGEYILTLFEDLSADSLPFYLHLIEHHCEQGVPCPEVVKNKNGHAIMALKHKPAVIMTFLPGQTYEQINPTMRAALGRALAQLHQSGLSFPEKADNPRGLDWMRQTASRLHALLSDEDNELLHDELDFQSQQDFEACPRGIIHADLFRDNVLFDNDKISAVLDFYYACHDYLAYDVAIVVNDWCFDEAGQLSIKFSNGLLQAYQATRPFTDNEKRAWPALLRLAALRFWISRLLDYHSRESGELIQIKDPDEFKRILILHRPT